MRPLAFALLCALAGVGPASAQEGLPRDARGLVQWHLRLAPSDDPDELLRRAWVYQRAGAEGEAWAALERVAALRPDDPDLLRFRARLALWNPELWEAGIADAERWEAEFGATRTEAERRSLRASLEELRRRVAARAAAGEGRRARALAPLVALALGVAALGLSWRRTRPARSPRP